MDWINKAIAGVSFIAILGIAAPLAIAQDGFSPYVGKDGTISFPDGFRNSMMHIGSWFVPEGDASGFHDVFTEKESAAAFRRTGKFPDGTTLVKELRASKSGSYTTGQGVNHATDLKQWFVMIKDGEGRFPGNASWGDGWGWALFKPGDDIRNVSRNYKSDCLACHVPAKSNDWIYTEAYPMLHSK